MGKSGKFEAYISLLRDFLNVVDTRLYPNIAHFTTINKNNIFNIFTQKGVYMKSLKYKSMHDELIENAIKEIHAWIKDFGPVYVSKDYSEKEIDLEYGHCITRIDINSNAVSSISKSGITTIKKTGIDYAKRQRPFEHFSAKNLIDVLAYIERFFRSKGLDSYDNRYPITLDEPTISFKQTPTGGFIDDVEYHQDTYFGVYRRKDQV